MEGASVKNRARRSGVRTRRTHKTPTTREKEPRKRNLGTGNNLVLCLRDARRPLSNRDANLRFATFWTRFFFCFAWFFIRVFWKEGEMGRLFDRRR